MKRLVGIYVLILFCLALTSVCNASPIFNFIPDDLRYFENELMMFEFLTGVGNDIFPTMVPGGRTVGLTFDLYSDLYAPVHPSIFLNEPNISLRMVSTTEASLIVGGVGYNAMGFGFNFNEGLFSPGYWEEESTYLQRSFQIKPSTVKDKGIDPGEPGHRPALVCIPATALLLGSGLIGFIGFKRRSKRLLND